MAEPEDQLTAVSVAEPDFDPRVRARALGLDPVEAVARVAVDVLGLPQHLAHPVGEFRIGEDAGLTHGRSWSRRHRTTCAKPIIRSAPAIPRGAQPQHHWSNKLDGFADTRRVTCQQLADRDQRALYETTKGASTSW
ncbi:MULTISPECIES: hypothetical protein [Amycolatopsis]|uniref:hypothetical protein n=1 Tax=Amycolatopsis TaxID=1813 RepID=UPI001F38972C|nr:hypothetical protein [Amycolatopsis tucumanensis]MCF6425132.1 hypothetical protein [Amycolatopsis tucumanensis]